MLRLLFVLVGLAVCGSGLAAQSGSLATVLGANGGGARGGAIYFDLTVANGVTITSLDLNCLGGPNTLVEVYAVAGATHVGNETGGAAFWGSPIAIGNITQVNPFDTLSNCPLLLPLPAGTYAIAIVNGAGHAYTNGNGANQFFSNAELSLAAGAASNVPFTGSVFVPRVWNGQINYALGASGNVAMATKSGFGCGGSPFGDGTFYEEFSGGGFDLANRGFTLTWNGDGYDFRGAAGPIVTPSGSASAFADDQTVEIPLGFSLPSPAGERSSVWVCSNGFLSFEETTNVDFSPSVAELLAGEARLCPLWTDLNPSAGGRVDAEVDPAGVFHITFTDVPEFPSVGANTFQVSLQPSGTIEVKYGAISAPDVLVGLSSGNAATDPGGIDISVASPFSFSTGVFSPTFDIEPGARPVIGTTADVQLVGEASGANSVLHLGIPFPSPFDLASAGFPGCLAYVDPIVVQTGTDLMIPNDPNLLGVGIGVQAVSLGNYSSSNGVATSGQVDWVIGDV